MKKLQQVFAAAVLTLAFTFSTFAGEILMPGATTPPPRQQSSITDDIGFPGETATGEIPTPGVDALDPETEAALNFFQSLLLLF